jgi:phosphate transport system substrate-binding protein
MNVFKIVLIATIAYCSLLLSACNQKPALPEKPAVTISGAGATFPAPLYAKWIHNYSTIAPDLEISYAAVGSGEGVRRFTTGEVDFGASDAAMSDAEIKMVDRGVKLIPATAGIIVLAYNLPGLNGDLKLSRSVYLDIFMGKIKHWKDPRIQQLNPGLNLPSWEIIPVVRHDSSGTTYAFTNHLAAIGASNGSYNLKATKLMAWPSNSMVANGNEGVAGRIRITHGSIGYVEYGFAPRAGLSMAVIENKAGNFVKPSPDNGTDTLANTVALMPENLRLFMKDPEGEYSYPIVTYSWLLLYGSYPDSNKLAYLKKFIEWSLNEGQQFSSDWGFCKLPPGVVQKSIDALNSIQ